MRTLNFVFALAIASFALANFATVSEAGHKRAVASCHALNVIDPDSDGRMTLGEAVRRGVKIFNASNPDGDRTLEPDEVNYRLSHAAFVSADRNKDGKLSTGEWVRRIVILFNKANDDRDGTIECDELHSGWGRGLKRMLH